MTHVTTFRFQSMPGKRDAVLEHFRAWERDQRAKATGFQRSQLVTSNANPDEITAIVEFDTTENYQRNSDRTEIDAWYRGLRADLAGDPEWFNGTVALETT